MKCYHYVSDNQSAVAVAIKAGCDIECGGGFFSDYMTPTLETGKIERPDVERAAMRMLTMAMRSGMLDPADRQPFMMLNMSNVDSPWHRS